MTCANIQRHLQHYVDDRLDARAASGVAAHLAGCAACRDDLRLLQAVRTGAAALPYVAEPERLTRSILARVAAFERQRAVATLGARFALRLADALLATALASLATVLFLLLQPGLLRMAAAPLQHALAPLQRGYVGFVGHWGTVLAWALWMGLGLSLTLWFAGSEVRSGWRRTLSQHLPWQ
ncbi:MAG TPA: zf-HC2 domain-containing protein [Ktedonobacterales bacterium]|nr:zf-HC2 domain-containing protein [Ktedonobacterales bacterium]